MQPRTDAQSEQDKADTERKLDHGLKETFPASDPVAVTPKTRKETERELDHGLKETFPASDPVSINPGAD